MSFAKTADQAMNYEVTGSKTTKTSGKRLAVKAAEQLNTSSLIWLLVRRHKVGLLAIGNVVLVLNWAFPEWTQLLTSLV